jgi:hypothetical protein
MCQTFSTLTNIGYKEDIYYEFEEGKETHTLHIEGNSIGYHYGLIENKEQAYEVPCRLKVRVRLNRLKSLTLYLFRFYGSQIKVILA